MVIPSPTTNTTTQQQLTFVEGLLLRGTVLGVL